MVSTASVSEGEPVSLDFSWCLGKKKRLPFGDGTGRVGGGSFLPEIARSCQACLREGKMLMAAAHMCAHMVLHHLLSAVPSIRDQETPVAPHICINSR